MDAYHFIMLTKIEEEVNDAIKKIVEKQPTRRGLMCKSMQYIYFVWKDLFKHDGYVIKKLCIRPWSFDCEKSPTFLTCGKRLVQAFCFTLVFLSGLLF